jgi:copper transport protein
VNERTPLRPSGRFRRIIAGAALATAGVVGLLGGTASAENSLESSIPADGSTVAQSPETISLTFNEPLGEVNTITVSCPDLFTVGPRELSADRLTMTAEVIDSLPKGSCVASYIVSDSEGSPNGQGNVTFTIENAAAATVTTNAATAATAATTGDSVPAGAGASTADGVTAVGASNEVAKLSDVDAGQGPLWLGRLLSVFGLAVLLGSLVVIAVAWPEGVEYLVTIRFIRATWLVAFVGTLLYVAAATAAVTDSGIGSGLSPANWFKLFEAGIPGIAAVSRLVLVVACAWVAFRPDRVIDPVTQMAALGVPALAVATIGFSRTNMDLAIIGVPLSIVHALAMSVWLGGVVLLARVVLAGPGDEDLVHAVRGFGRLSNLAIGITIATGIVQMILLDGGDLFGTSHGRVILLKTVAVAGMIFVAVSARQFVNQRLARANEMTVPMADRLRRAFGVEAIAGVLVLAMSAWLLSLSPANATAGPDISYAIVLPVEAPEADIDLTVRLTLDRVGLSGLEVAVDAPAENLSGLEIVFTAPANDIVGTITQPVPLTGAGVAVLLEGDQGLPLTVAGDWTMVVNAVTPTGVFSSPPQGFIVLNADGTDADIAPAQTPVASIPSITQP